MTAAGISLTATARNQPSGTNATPGTTDANIGQQQYFADAMTKGVLPTFKKRGQPFSWCSGRAIPMARSTIRATASISFPPGINGPTSLAAIHNADNNLKQIMELAGGQRPARQHRYLPHGRSRLHHHQQLRSRRLRDDRRLRREAHLQGRHRRQEVNTGFLPVGFLAIDLANNLKLPLYDPDHLAARFKQYPGELRPGECDKAGGSGKKCSGNPDRRNRRAAPGRRRRSDRRLRPDPQIGQNGGVAVTGANFAVTNSPVVIAANGGSDLIYLPNGTLAQRAALARQVAGFMVQKDYVSGIFADDAFGVIPGTLPEGAINLKGTTSLPAPALVVNFRTFSIKPTDPALPTDPLLNAVQFADSGLQEGQGMHGSFDRADTFNFMAAIGPRLRGRLCRRRAGLKRRRPGHAGKRAWLQHPQRRQAAWPRHQRVAVRRGMFRPPRF